MNERYQKSRDYLYSILMAKGVIYTLGMCMGILARLSVSDYRLYKELEERSVKQPKKQQRDQ